MASVRDKDARLFTKCQDPYTQDAGEGSSSQTSADMEIPFKLGGG